MSSNSAANAHEVFEGRKMPSAHTHPVPKYTLRSPALQWPDQGRSLADADELLELVHLSAGVYHH